MTVLSPFDDSKIYHVKKIQGTNINITGKGDNSEWGQADELSDFIYPWENKKSTSMTFKALHSQDWFYCLYQVEEDDIKVYVKTDHKSEVIRSERVEIFFRRDDTLSTYYALELDPLARILDYEARYHREFNSNWRWPEGKLIVKTDRTEYGYTVEVAIHKESLQSLGLLKGEKLEAGIFRAECEDIDESEPAMKWISWLKPDSETPDFHIPSSFGTLILEE